MHDLQTNSIALTPEPTQHTPLALVVEEFACASMLLRTLGYAVEAYHPHALCASITRPITAAIRHGRFLLVWIHDPPDLYLLESEQRLTWRWHSGFVPRAYLAPKPL